MTISFAGPRDTQRLQSPAAPMAGSHPQSLSNAGHAPIAKDRVDLRFSGKHTDAPKTRTLLTWIGGLAAAVAVTFPLGYAAGNAFTPTSATLAAPPPAAMENLGTHPTPSSNNDDPTNPDEASPSTEAPSDQDVSGSDNISQSDAGAADDAQQSENDDSTQADDGQAATDDATSPSTPSPAPAQQASPGPTVQPPTSAAPVQTPQSIATATGGFHTEGSRIIGPDGKEFIARGINLSNDMFDTSSPESIKKTVDQIVDVWKFNAVRLPAYILSADEKKQNPDLYGDSSDGGVPSAELIKQLTDRGVVVLINAHDTAGHYYPDAMVPHVKQYYLDMAKNYQNNHYVWWDLFNEPGNGGNLKDSAQWVKLCRELIPVIRDQAGNQNPIMAEEHAYGEGGMQAGRPGADADQSVILSHMNDIRTFNGKTYGNLIAQFHSYENWGHQDGENPEERMTQYIQGIQQGLNIPVVDGEYGTEGENATDAPKVALAVAPRLSVGLFVWEWRGGDGNKLTVGGDGGGDTVQFDANGNPTNLTELGRLVWENNHRP